MNAVWLNAIWPNAIWSNELFGRMPPGRNMNLQSFQLPTTSQMLIVALKGSEVRQQINVEQLFQVSQFKLFRMTN